MAMFSLFDMLGRACPRLDIVDVGAMWLGSEALAYRALLKGDTHVLGFEPAQEECDKLNAMRMRNHTYLPCFIGDGSERTFHICNRAETSSLYEPNTPLLSRFTDIVEVATLERTTPVATRRLDDIEELTRMDLLKVDVQGGELDVLKGGERLLRSCVVVQTEVEFVPMYKGQPLFGDIDVYMREQGFLLHSLGPTMFARAMRPFSPRQGMTHQLMWTDAVYVKDFMKFDTLPAEQLLRLAVILHEQYKACDMAALAFQHYDAKSGAGLWKIYTSRLTGGTPLAPPPL
jgi:FkbM family methyltransferase